MNYHEAGALRHGVDWINANQAAVGVLADTKLKPWNPEIKQIMPRVLLRVLDMLKMQAGYKWDKDISAWVRR